MNLNNLFLSLSKKGLQFLNCQLVLVIVFAILYWIFDYMLIQFPKISNDLYLGHYNNVTRVEPFYYWFWHSLITQTTVGYAGLVNNHGKSISIITNQSNIYKLINIVQLISTFIVTAKMM